MTTYGTHYEDLLTQAKNHLAEASEASRGGDLWQAHIHLKKAANAVSEATSLLEEVSKVAFERVFKERAR